MTPAFNTRAASRARSRMWLAWHRTSTRLTTIQDSTGQSCCGTCQAASRTSMATVSWTSRTSKSSLQSSSQDAERVQALLHDAPPRGRVKRSFWSLLAPSATGGAFLAPQNLTGIGAEASLRRQRRLRGKTRRRRLSAFDLRSPTSPAPNRFCVRLGWVSPSDAS
jgi:hypothetical protein